LTAARERLLRVLGPDMIEVLDGYVRELMDGYVSDRLAGQIREMIDDQQERKRWLGVLEAADYLSCSPGAIYQRVHRGTIPFTHDGGRLLIDRKALDVELDRRRV
jgi:excisionase family DNA binding protein